MKFIKTGLVLLALSFVLSGCSPANVSSEDPQSDAQPAKAAQYDQSQVNQDFANQAMTVTDVSERNIDSRQVLTIRFSVPINPANNHQNYFALQYHSKEGYRDVDDGLWVIDQSGRFAWFNATEPSTQYRVTVNAGLVGGNGKALAKAHSVDLTTRELSPTVTFDTNGHFIAKGLSNGLPVRGVNVDEVNIDFFRVDSDNISEFLQRMSYGHYSWNTYSLAELGQLVYSGRYDLSANKNQQFSRNIDVASIQQLQQHGVYLAVMAGAGVYNERDVLWFSVTDLALHVRQYPQSGQMQVQVSSLKSSQAIAGVKVTLYGRENQGEYKQFVIATSTTDAKGFAQFDGVGDNVHLIVAHDDKQLSLVQRGKPQLDLSPFDIGSRPQLPVELFIYAPRDLYRPGEAIDFSAIIRDGDGQKQQPPTLDAKILRPNGTVAHEFRFGADEQGYYHYNWSIPFNAPVGDWQLEIKSVLKQAQSYLFKVEEFMPERMKLSFNPQGNNPIVAGANQSFSLPIVGEYLYGAPTAGNRASASMQIRHWRAPIESLAQYEFGHIKDTSAFGYYDLDDIRLDGEGKGSFNNRIAVSESSTPLQIRYTVSLYESGGRPVTRGYSALMWPQPQLLGIAPRYARSADHGGPEENSRVKFDLVKADVNGQLFDATNIEVNLVREDKQYYWVHDSHRGWHYQYNEKEYTEMTQTVDLSSQNAVSVEFPVEYGHYRLEVLDRTNRLVSSYRFHAGSDWYASWQHANEQGTATSPDKVTLALDKASYTSGDTAQLTIVAPQAGTALVMVEGNGILWSQQLEVTDKAQSISIPIDSSWQQHNLYVTAMVVQKTVAQKGNKQAEMTPKRSLGLIHLPLSRESRKLDLTIDVADKLVPNQTIKARVKVNNWQAGQSEPGISLAVVDVGVLNISDFATPDPFEHFYGQRAYQVQMRDIYDQLIESNTNQTATLRFGGDADLARGGEEPKADVQIVSQFYLPVTTKDGVAEFDVALPDFNGRLRLMALGFVDDNFGSTDKEVIVAAPVVAQMAMPRFIATGDKSTLALDLNNLTETQQDVVVELTVDGAVQLISAAKADLTLEAKQKRTLTFAIEATKFKGQGHIQLKVNGIVVDGAEVAINKSWQLAVRPPYGPEYIANIAVLTQGQRFDLSTKHLSHLVPNTVQARMSMSNRVDLGVGEQLKHLMQYPYGCLEQSSSRAYVLAFADSESQRLISIDKVDEVERQKMLAKGIERVASLQLSNGGFGLWSDQSPEEHWLSAYVADFLLSAKQQGVNVPEQVLNNALSRLRTYLRSSKGFLSQRYSVDSSNYIFSYRAYAAYVLSRVNRAPLSYLRRMNDKQLSQSQTLLPRVHLAMALINMGDKRRGYQLLDKVMGDFFDYSRNERYYGDYGSDVRDTAMMVHLLLSNDTYTQAAGLMSSELVKMIRQKMWFSTQERNALFLAGVALAKAQQSQWRGKLTVAEQSQVIETLGQHGTRLSWQDLAAGVSFESDSRANIYLSSEVVGYSKTAPKPYRDSMSIKRRWYSIKGKPIEPQQVKVGDLVIVGLTVSAEQRSPDALVIDKVPAGFEPENQNLLHGVKLADLKVEGRALAQWTEQAQIKHQEYRDDRFVAAVDLDKNRPMQLFYLLRAVTPGEYAVPAPMIEDMYFPQWRAVGETRKVIKVVE